jgi:hypothetical protein
MKSKAIVIMALVGVMLVGTTGVASADSVWSASTTGVSVTGGAYGIPQWTGNGSVDAELTDTTPGDGRCAILRLSGPGWSTDVVSSCGTRVTQVHAYIGGTGTVNAQACQSVAGVCSAVRVVTY